MANWWVSPCISRFQSKVVAQSVGSPKGPRRAWLTVKCGCKLYINAILMQFSKIYYQPININFIGIPDFLDQWWPMDLCIRINDFLSVICHSSLRGMVEHSFPGAHHSRERNSLVDWGRPCPDWLRKVRDQALWVKCWSAGFSQTLSAFALLLHVSKPPLA